MVAYLPAGAFGIDKGKTDDEHRFHKIRYQHVPLPRVYSAEDEDQRQEQLYPYETQYGCVHFAAIGGAGGSGRRTSGRGQESGGARPTAYAVEFPVGLQHQHQKGGKHLIGPKEPVTRGEIELELWRKELQHFGWIHFATNRPQRHYRFIMDGLKRKGGHGKSNKEDVEEKIKSHDADADDAGRRTAEVDEGEWTREVYEDCSQQKGDLEKQLTTALEDKTTYPFAEVEVSISGPGALFMDGRLDPAVYKSPGANVEAVMSMAVLRAFLSHGQESESEAALIGGVPSALQYALKLTSISSPGTSDEQDNGSTSEKVWAVKLVLGVLLPPAKLFYAGGGTRTASGSIRQEDHREPGDAVNAEQVNLNKNLMMRAGAAFGAAGFREATEQMEQEGEDVVGELQDNEAAGGGQLHDKNEAAANAAHGEQELLGYRQTDMLAEKMQDLRERLEREERAAQQVMTAHLLAWSIGLSTLAAILAVIHHVVSERRRKEKDDEEYYRATSGENFLTRVTATCTVSAGGRAAGRLHQPYGDDDFVDDETGDNIHRGRFEDVECAVGAVEVDCTRDPEDAQTMHWSYDIHTALGYKLSFVVVERVTDPLDAEGPPPRRLNLLRVQKGPLLGQPQMVVRELLHPFEDNSSGMMMETICGEKLAVGEHVATRGPFTAPVQGEFNAPVETGCGMVLVPVSPFALATAPAKEAHDTITFPAPAPAAKGANNVSSRLAMVYGNASPRGSNIDEKAPAMDQSGGGRGGNGAIHPMLRDESFENLVAPAPPLSVPLHEPETGFDGAPATTFPRAASMDMIFELGKKNAEFRQEKRESSNEDLPTTFRLIKQENRNRAPAHSDSTEDMIALGGDAFNHTRTPSASQLGQEHQQDELARRGRGGEAHVHFSENVDKITNSNDNTRHLDEDEDVEKKNQHDLCTSTVGAHDSTPDVEFEYDENQPGHEVVLPDALQQIVYAVHLKIVNHELDADCLHQIVSSFFHIETANEFDDHADADNDGSEMNATYF
eukprot:g13801.t1